MREIKFRAFDIENKEMLKVENLYFNNISNRVEIKTLMYSDYFNENEMILMQYTGLKDKNGKEIYEGDIVEILWYYRKTRYVVKYGEYKIDCCGCCYNEHNAYGFYLEHIKLRDAQQSINDDEYAQQSINDDEIVEIVVIGNIYDNPELLEN